MNYRLCITTVATVTLSVACACPLWVATGADRPLAMPAGSERSHSAIGREPGERRDERMEIVAVPTVIPFGREAPRSTARRHESDGVAIQLCQALGPAAPHSISGVDCVADGCGSTGGGELGWEAMGPIRWQAYAQGEYVGPARTAHVDQYRVRPDDRIDFVYRLTRDKSHKPYELNVGDVIRVESFADERLNRDQLIVQPDGTITLRLLGQVPAWGRTVAQLRQDLERRYTKYYHDPAITVTPLRVNAKLEDLRATVDARAGRGGQQIRVRVTPEGTIQLPALSSVLVQGLTLDEVKREVDARYAACVEGIEVTPVLAERAPRFVYVLGEVRNPGRFTLEGPTTVMQSIALAGGWNVGGNLRQVVVFRRGDDWRLLATLLDVQGALYGRRPCPADEIWLSDSDIVLVPKAPILIADEFIDLVFTRGIYGAMPFQGISINFSKLGSL
ncbi:MAG: polysaccharide biosynthesis/export family protein [Pirellulales bacterium]